MADTQPHVESLESALQVLRDRLGSQWGGREGAGRAEMVRVLEEALGYTKHQANAVIDSLIHIDRLHYHPAGEQPSEAGGRAPALFGLAGVSGGVPGSGLALSVGHWQIGPEYE
jgi:hypothetical protein